MSLYHLAIETRAIQDRMEDWAAEHDGDITDFPFLDNLKQLEDNRESAAIQAGLMYKNLMAEAEMIKAEKLILAKRQSALESRAETVKRGLKNFLEAGEKYRNPKCVIGWRKSSELKLKIEAKELPDEFRKIEYKAKLKELKPWVKNCPEEYSKYAEIVEKNNITIG